MKTPIDISNDRSPYEEGPNAWSPSGDPSSHCAYTLYCGSVCCRGRMGVQFKDQWKHLMQSTHQWRSRGRRSAHRASAMTARFERRIDNVRPGRPDTLPCRAMRQSAASRDVHGGSFSRSTHRRVCWPHDVAPGHGTEPDCCELSRCSRVPSCARSRFGLMRRRSPARRLPICAASGSRVRQPVQL